MGSKQSKVRITVPHSTCCFPSYSDSELLELAKEVRYCHSQAVEVASWIGTIVGIPATPVAQIALSAATILFTFLIHRLTSNPNESGNKVHQSRKSLEDALIDFKVSAAIAKKSVCELQAKLCVINNRYQRLVSDICTEERRLEVVPAIQTCEEVLQLFHDPTHVFRLNPLVSSPFLVSFAGIFVAIAEISLVLIPSYKGPLVGEMNLLTETLALYQTACVYTRMERIKFRRSRLGPESMLDVVAGGMPEMNYSMEDTLMEGLQNGERDEACQNSSTEDQMSNESNTVSEDEVERVYQDVNEAIAAYRVELEDEYEKFFKETYETISKFSGFDNNVRCIQQNTSDNVLEL